MRHHPQILSGQDMDRIALAQSDEDRRFGRKMWALIIAAYGIAIALGALVWVLA